MKEFWALLKKWDLKGIFITPTKNGFLQFFRYVFVGGIATIVDWGVYYLLSEVAGIHYLVAHVVSFFAGLITNFVLSKLLVFKANEAKVNPVLEFVGYAVIGLIGLGLSALIIFLLHGKLGLNNMVSKIISTLIVLVWNYVARKLILYRK
jgi:putative flippase GtrA